MAPSFEARRSVCILTWHVKRRLKGVRDYRVAPRIFHPDAYDRSRRSIPKLCRYECRCAYRWRRIFQALYGHQAPRSRHEVISHHRKERDIGGTWWDNRYPGCACDILSHLYSFSFAPSTEWTRMHPGQQEIHDYLKRCVKRYGLQPYLGLNTCFHEAIWDESKAYGM